VFTNWTRADVFTFYEVSTDPSGHSVTNTSTVVSLVPSFARNPMLQFTMQPEYVLVDIPGVRTITRSSGWQANFVVATKPAPSGSMGPPEVLFWEFQIWLLWEFNRPGSIFSGG
jgi:hypothetical protein